METAKQYKEVKCSDRLPEKPGWYITNMGSLEFAKTNWWYEYKPPPTWWLEELPSSQPVTELRDTISDAMDNLATAIAVGGSVDVADYVDALYSRLQQPQPMTDIEALGKKLYNEPKFKVIRETVNITDLLMWINEQSTILSRLQPQIITEGEIEKMCNEQAQFWNQSKANPFDIARICIEAGARWAITALQGKEQRGRELQEIIVQRILSLESQIDAPEILDQKRIECKLEAYREVLSYMEESAPPPKKQGDNGKEGSDGNV